MISGPDSLFEENSIAAMCPYNFSADYILKEMGISIISINNEKELDAFTVGVCLPVILLSYINKKDTKDVEYAVEKLESFYPWFLKVYLWSKKVIPVFSSEAETKEYVFNMAKKGGIADAVIEDLKLGNDFLTAINNGIRRSQEITKNMNKLVGH